MAGGRDTDLTHPALACKSASISSACPGSGPPQRYIGEATACDSNTAALMTAQIPASRCAAGLKWLRKSTSADITIASAEAGRATKTCQNMMVVGDRAKQISAAPHVAVT